MKEAIEDLKKQVIQLFCFAIACTLLISATLLMPLEESNYDNRYDAKTTVNNKTLHKKKVFSSVYFF